MVQLFFKKIASLAIALCLSFLLCHGSALAAIYSFKSPGTPGEEGVLIGSITYDPDVVRESLNKIEPNKGMSRGLVLQELGKDSKFSFEYISPHSGIKHSQDTICVRNIYDLDNGLPENEVLGGFEGPYFNFSSPLDLESIDFRSCVGKGDISSSISERDTEIAFSELESLFNQLKIMETTYTRSKPGRFRKKFHLEFKLQEL